MKLYEGKLFKITSTHDNIRTESMEGVTHEPPKMDQGFIMQGTALESSVDGGRIIFTTPVLELVQLSNGTSLFRTRNSTYAFRLDKEFEYEPKSSV